MPTSPGTPAERPADLAGVGYRGIAGYVGVVGPGAGATPDDVDQATRVGRALAERGLVVLTGGLDGVMAGAALGCREAGGLSIGLLPGSDRRRAGPHHTVTLPTGLGELRNGLLVRACDAVVSVGASWGTLSEVALACRAGIPVVLLGWDPAALAGVEGPGRPPQHVTTVDEAVAVLLGALGAG